MKSLSIIVPCNNEEETIPVFFSTVNKIQKQVSDYQFHYIFIDDGSKDKTLFQLRKLHQQFPKIVNYLSFSRPFGKEAGLYAGLRHAKGDLVAVMDVDLQDPPELLPRMIQGIKAGYDVIGSRRVNRSGEGKIRSFFSNLFYKIINHLSDVPMKPGVRDYRLMTQPVVQAILRLEEYNRFSKGIFEWVGFKTKYLDFKNRDRAAGKTSWSFGGLIRYSIQGIINFSQTPLTLAAWIGFLLAIAAFIALIIIIIHKLLVDNSASGWASLISVVLLIGGLQLFFLGVVGKYIANIYTETKKRPLYIIKEAR